MGSENGSASEGCKRDLLRCLRGEAFLTAAQHLKATVSVPDTEANEAQSPTSLIVSHDTGLLRKPVLVVFTTLPLRHPDHIIVSWP